MDDTYQIAEAAIELAGKWQDRANTLRSPRERARQRKFTRLFESTVDKVILTKLIDQSFRCADNRRAADQIHYLLTEYGIPGFFSSLEKSLMVGFIYAGRFLPGLTVPAIIEKLRQDSNHMIIPGEAVALDAFLQKRKRQGLRININYIGEEVVGEQEALSRLDMYLKALENPTIEYISVKISTIFSQIQPLAFEHTVGILQARLSELYRSAAAHEFVRQDGSKVNKFVNLDMESYRDLAITAQAFIRTLDQDEFKDHHAGMALQAYLPDSYHILQQITAWARKRVAAGGSPIKIRIVKGANMEMEKIESAIFDWPLAPFDNKLEVDANWKRVVDFGMQPENIRAVRLGIASHNLFDLAYAYLVARKNKITDFFSFEMIEGMADHLRWAIQQTGQEMVLYAPVATRNQFINAIGYLIRRLDENTGEKNFLRHLNRLKTNSDAWQFLTDHFKASIRQKDRPAKTPHRIQNRLTEKFPDKMGPLNQPPQGDLKKALTALETGESWALQPQNIDNNPFIWTPGIKWGVRPQSYTHMTEFFGPLLGVIRADNLEHAIELANQTGYGLTSGLESLDPREEKYWKDRIKAGNLYVNRGTTGAVTLRQPFGGMGKSALGSGIKAGSPKYVAQFMEFEEISPPTGNSIQNSHPLLNLALQWKQKLDDGGFHGVEADIQKTIGAIKSYIHHVAGEFSRRLDYFHLRGQDNILRYQPVGTVVIRLHQDDSIFETLAGIAAVKISGCKLRISSPKDLDTSVTRFLDTKEGRQLIGGSPVVYELDKELIKSIPIIDRIRYAAPERVPQDVYRAAAETGFHISRTPVMMDGRIELLQYYRQQSICNNYHRYGNLGERALEFKSKSTVGGRVRNPGPALGP